MHILTFNVRSGYLVNYVPVPQQWKMMTVEQIVGQWAGTLFSSQFCYEIKNVIKVNFIHLKRYTQILAFAYTYFVKLSCYFRDDLNNFIHSC